MAVILTNEELAERLERATREAADAVYAERNQCVALLARMALALGWRAGVARTAIEGWDPAWHGCVYIDLPTGQVSWHYHEREADRFAGLPAYAGPWDGHDTAEKYARVNACRPDVESGEAAMRALEHVTKLREMSETLLAATRRLGLFGPRLIGPGIPCGSDLAALDVGAQLDAVREAEGAEGAEAVPTDSEGAEVCE